MSNPIFNDLSLRAISTALDGLSLRQRVTADNIANVDTPGFKAQQVSFEDQLQGILKEGTDESELTLAVTHSGHQGHTTNLPSNSITVTRRNNVLRNDGNNVDIDVEMSTLAETALRYQALTQLAGTKLSLLKSIIRDSS